MLETLDWLSPYQLSDVPKNGWLEQDHLLLKISKEEIEDAESRIELKFPAELKAFLLKYGSGFLFQSDDFLLVNRFFHPRSIANCRLKTHEFAHHRFVSPYDLYGYEFLIFFEIIEGAFLALDLRNLDESGRAPIYFYRKRVANSLEEFLLEMREHPNGYLESSNSPG